MEEDDVRGTGRLAASVANLLSEPSIGLPCAQSGLRLGSRALHFGRASECCSCRAQGCSLLLGLQKVLRSQGQYRAKMAS
jgi:hypothetical protein